MKLIYSFSKEDCLTIALSLARNSEIRRKQELSVFWILIS